MTVDSSRRGSALLIVLGMLAFMVVSAVSFSAYMRSSRLPSSYLRRTAAARQLAKAALAEAIERLDVAIGENAYPDQRIGDQAPNLQRLSLLGAHGTSSRNYWYNNIFIGTNAFLSAEDTVATLTLEGLAYIPPPLVNEARRYSRMSRAATWHTLGFDAGRYAYCAIDVSDCFDINRLVANGRRNSGRRRVTLAHLFEKPDKHDTYDLDPSRWETFMENFRSKVKDEDDASEGRISKTKVPLVSLADWNLAANDNDSSQLPTPFCSYVENESGVAFYGGVSPKGAEASRLRSMRIVTDSFLPGLSEEQLEREKLVDLASEDGQPFQASDFDDGANVDAIFELGNNGTEGYKALISDFLSNLDMICLYDYLDYNNVPVSLALPTTERVPMVCAVTPGISTTLKCVTETLSENKDGSLRKIAYKLDGEKFCSGAISTLVAFPFRRGTERNDNFTYEACLRLFFAPPAGDFQSFRLPKATIRPTNDDDFKETGYADGVFKVALMSDTEPKFTNVQTEESAVRPLDFLIPPASVAALKKFFAEHPVFTITAKQQKDKEGNTTTEITEAECNIMPLDSKGQINSKYGGSAFLNIVQDKEADPLALHIAVFIRVKNSKGKTVDLVPADVTDDKRFNDVDNGYWSLAFDRNKGPLLRFDAGETIKFTMADFESLDRGIAYNPAGIMCPDPRFNHAPENWISKSANNASTWLNNCDAANRDGDIFMFVSDQGYLQSIYELAFLPNLSEMRHYGDSVLGAYSIREMASYPSAIGDCTNGSLMWNTYRCYRNGSLARHNFEDIGLVLNDSSFRVNPCSQSVDALMAAFANTPYDWWAASTNNVDINASDVDSASAFNKKYAFSEMNSTDKITWDELNQIAANFRDAVRAKNGDWEAAFDSLDWFGDESDFCGVDSSNLSNLSTADRKFLYGFWHDSFANRQQLFLIFVRAEPTMMGGGSVNQTPPQLGARAVALVWRDPGMEYPSTDASKPHRTRVLFYRQFE